MHRILNIAGNEKNKDDLIEQPDADFIFITSVKSVSYTHLRAHET